MNVYSEEFRRDPFPVLERLRRQSPVIRTEPYGAWAVLRHEDVLGVLRKPDVFPSAISSEPEPEGPSFLLETRTLIGSDGEAHNRFRRLIDRSFVPGRVRDLIPFVRKTANALVERAGTQFDAVAEVSSPLPIAVICRLLGVDFERVAEMREWVEVLLTWRNQFRITDPRKRSRREEEIRRASGRMWEFLTGVIEDRTRSPGEDLVSALLRAHESDCLDRKELLGFLRLLFVAGTETTTHLISNSLLNLSRMPELGAELRVRPEQIPAFIEETLRYSPPALCLLRGVAQETEIRGTRLAAGSRLLLFLASANRDESVFPEANCFRLNRAQNPHLSFGGGVHFCLGAPLARMQAKMVLEALLERWDFLELENENFPYLDSFFFRGPRCLPLRARLNRSRGQSSADAPHSPSRYRPHPIAAIPQ